jgi:tRNA 5-methylaminomethyl-2-thiouridine biosynthesis bifunctional protein
MTILPNGVSKFLGSLGSLSMNSSDPKKQPSQPWHLDKSAVSRRSKDVTVLGAGIAGCTAAVALARRGFKVRVIDRFAAAGCGGSGNNQAVIYPKLSTREEALPRINLAAIQFASQYYQPFWQQGLGAQTGVLVLPENTKALADFRRIAERFNHQPDLVQLCSNTELRALAGIDLEAELGLYFPNLGWLQPQGICRQLLAQHHIPLIQADIQSLSYTDGQWHMTPGENTCDQANTGNLSSESLVIANAYDCLALQQSNFLPVTQLRGQITHIPSNQRIAALKTVICGEGYITPQYQGSHSCGATYNKGLFTTQVREADHQTNLEQMAVTDQGLAEAIGPQDLGSLSGRANYRCTTRDYLPIVGPVPNVPQLLEDYAPLRKDARADILSPGSYLPNLFVHCGMGSRGMGYAPLTAEILASEIAGEQSPIDPRLRLALHPARFLIQDLKKKRL